MDPEKILITGASGCVGQYTATWLLENSNAELFLWLRNPKKLTAISIKDPRVNLLVGDLREATNFAKELSTITRVIHTATAWGDPKRAYEVNVVAVKTILKLLNPTVIKQIIYFSTASILDRELQPLQKALQYGTEYIQSKAQCLQDLEQHPLAEKIIAVFPTLVFGGKVDGSSQFPTSYLTSGLQEGSKWIWLARCFRVKASFHFIHASDIAFICGHLATNPNPQTLLPKSKSIRFLVLGQPYISINTAINDLRRWKGMRKLPQIPLWDWLIKVLIKILPLQISAWDRFSIKQRHFIHHPITRPEDLGGQSKIKTIEEVLRYSRVPRY